MSTSRNKKALELASRWDLEHIPAPASQIDPIKIENCIGFTKVPLGVAGPLRVKGPNADGSFYAPLATQEATLVASCSRGCKAFSASGGVQFDVLSQGMSRAPVFIFANPASAVKFAREWPSLEEQFGKWAASTSRYAKLQKTKAHIIGSQVHLFCSFHCAAASGQNMVSKATKHACDQLRSLYGDNYSIKDWVVEGNLSSDKKPSWGNVKDARGVEVVAWGSVSDHDCQNILGCTTKRLNDQVVTLIKGGIRNGMFGSNVNTTNVLAGMFIATGQDAASVGESAWSDLTPEYDEETKVLTLSLYFPSILIATVGGGTGNPTQREALRMVQCDQPEDKEKLAGLMASFALALDISTAAAIANDTFTASHMRLARGEAKPKL
ncbi:unnamed protein product [Clonostachys chloroleuca]|uniref:hydroxymethylglutaryl-CoA reductase (NADPH) n=1 Tax=Clonostachys chloroleuca TaxID=1926264 RepID=A0AA35M6G4_9HYPO|nr:unnamed protein product [Clonostachys chloroleuca]